jgi:antitoxin ParD1/3/4
MNRAPHLQELASLTADIGNGLTELAECRVKDFDANRVTERGTGLFAGPSR